MNRKDKVRQQFGATAEGYATSEIHAKGQDLAWIVEEVSRLEPRSLLALDIATGAGNTAFALSSCVGRVIGLDLTEQMVEVAARGARERGIRNVTWMVGDAEQLAFPDQLFDVITCRLAAHHFPRVAQAFKEVVRCLVPGGCFILIDNVAPEGPGEETLYNQIEALRDPSHGHIHTVEGWTSFLKEAGFTRVERVRAWTFAEDMHQWFERMKTPQDHREKILALLKAAPSAQQAALGFDPSSDRPKWLLRKALWVCKK
ncbi:class I SAM-dependent methyltransferase [Laceyella putida]|uniref:Class I SAM-dependent methyltransferase n=1 Tax=Laceyella putida TaxID=110101 RepID=A0ABW2RKE1_9BACL